MIGIEKNGLTLFCCWKKGREQVWTAVWIPACSWFAKQAAAAGDGGLEDNKHCVVRIPAAAMPKGYVSPEEYARLEAPQGKWTVQPGNVVAKGCCELKPERLAEILSLPCERFVVTAARDNRRGPRMLQHLKVEGR